METMASSMADHLRGQEYSRLRRSASTVLTEPPVSEDAALKLLEAYERDDTSPQDYLALVTEQRAFTPSPATNAVVIDTASYCANTAVPVILKSFLQDHGNPKVKEVLSEHGVAMLEKIPSGGVLIRLRSSEEEAELVGEEVNLLGRRFKIKRQSLLTNKFYLDISGIHSTEEANMLFMALCALGAPPLFLTPRDVNLETQVVTPTWRYYFGSESAPQCLVVHQYVTHQLVYGRNFYVARGKRSSPPPGRPTTYRQSRYAVVLPFGYDLDNWLSGQTKHAISKTAAVGTMAQNNSSVSPSSEANMLIEHPDPPSDLSASLSETHKSPNVTQRQNASLPSLPTIREEEWKSVCSSQGDSSGDVDMTKHLETGFKRIEPSFADANPFSALEGDECDFEVVQPQSKSTEKITGIVMIPHHTSSDKEHTSSSPAPSKKRVPSGTQQQDDDDDLAIEEALLLSEEESRLLVQEDHIEENFRHCRAAEALLHGSKNMDQIVQSICSVPLAWSRAFLKDLVAGGEQTLQLANIHLWNRVLAANAMDDDDSIRTFHQRLTALELPMGNSRSQYTSFLNGVFEKLPDDLQNEWDLLRWLSMFELLALSACPAIFEQHGWIRYLVANADESLPHTQVKLLTNQTLLQLLRSVFGEKLIEAANKVAPGSKLLIGLEALRSSNFPPEKLPTLSTSLLTTPQVSPTTEVGACN